MGIYLPNIEMQKSCAFCKIKRRNGKKMTCPLCNEEWDIHDPMSADHRLDNCHLVHVPPHGRLIDADALFEEVYKVWGTEYDASECNSLMGFINDAPTIIPAEEGE